MNKTDTNYIRGSARKFTFDNGGETLNVSLNLEDLQSLPSIKGYVQITIAERKSPDQYGNTHYIKENTFKADKTKGSPKKEDFDSSPEETDDLPF
jgi:hypothetical protein